MTENSTSKIDRAGCACTQENKQSFRYHMHWMLEKINKWGSGIGSKGGARARGSIIITMETGEDRFNQLWLHPVKEHTHRILPLFLGTIVSQSGCPFQTYSCEVTNQLHMSLLLKPMVVFFFFACFMCKLICWREIYN